jgi:hypothetical protein
VTEQITRPATLEDLKTLLRSLNANGVDYLLIGGYALAAHDYQRAQREWPDIRHPTTITYRRYGLTGNRSVANGVTVITPPPILHPLSAGSAPGPVDAPQ